MTAPLLLSVFPTFAVGGAQARFATVANHFGPNWRHAIVALDGVVACRERLDPSLDVSFPDAGARKNDTLGNVSRFRAMLRTLRPHRLLTHNFGSIEWAMANRPSPVHSSLVRHVQTRPKVSSRARRVASPVAASVTKSQAARTSGA